MHSISYAERAAACAVCIPVGQNATPETPKEGQSPAPPALTFFRVLHDVIHDANSHSPLLDAALGCEQGAYLGHEPLHQEHCCVPKLLQYSS